MSSPEGPDPETEHVRQELGAAVAGGKTPLATADLLCDACVRLLEVDGAAISLTHRGTTRGTFGSSGALSKRLDELQFTFGEGPCLDAARDGLPVLAADLADPAEQRWPAFTRAVLDSGIRAVFAMPVAIASRPVGALDLFRSSSGSLSRLELAGSLLAAALAARPLLDLLKTEADRDETDEAIGAGPIDRVEVYQATGMIIGATGISPSEALLQLRAYAFVHEMTASEVAWAIVERKIRLNGGDWRDSPPPGSIPPESGPR